MTYQLNTFGELSVVFVTISLLWFALHVRIVHDIHATIIKRREKHDVVRRIRETTGG